MYIYICMLQISSIIHTCRDSTNNMEGLSSNSNNKIEGNMSRKEKRTIESKQVFSPVDAGGSCTIPQTYIYSTSTNTFVAFQPPISQGLCGG